MAQIIEAIRAQTLPCEIIVWDNGGTFRDTDKVDVVIRSSRNFGSFARFPLIGFVRTRYVWTQDDDWIITDEKLFEKLADKDGCYVYTRGGKTLREDGGYPKAGSNVEKGAARVYNTGYSWFETRLLSEDLPINPLFCERPLTLDELPYADDVWVSAHTPGVVMPCIVKGVREIEHSDGLCFDPRHYPMRDSACKRLLA